MSLPEFEGSQSITYIGIIATGLTYMGAPIIVPFIRSFPRCQRPMLLAGWALCIVGLLAGSFATTVPALIATQGVTYGGMCNAAVVSPFHTDPSILQPPLLTRLILT